MEADFRQIGSVAFSLRRWLPRGPSAAVYVGPDPPLSWEPVEPVRREPSPGDDEQEAGRGE